jgi:hypothetical protein
MTLFSYPKLFGAVDNNGYGLKVHPFLNRDAAWSLRRPVSFAIARKFTAFRPTRKPHKRLADRTQEPRFTRQ